MSEWLIDIIKEWVLAQAYATEAWVLAKVYATEAWVLAKVYATEAWVTEWFTPYSVTGPLNPNATCLYFKAGTYDGKPYYRRSDGEWFIWWDEPNSWNISQAVGSLVPVSWFRVDPGIEGPYLEGQQGIGIATVSLGHKSLCTSFVDRGDPAVPDWTEANFTEDSAWHDLDLSAIVPAGAKVVLFSLWLRNTLKNKDAQLRKKGNSNEVNMSIIRTQVGGVYIFNDLSCPCDSDRKIQYRFTAGDVYTTRLTVKGWWL